MKLPGSACALLWQESFSTLSEEVSVRLTREKLSPPLEHGRCWWIDLASSASKRRRIVLPHDLKRLLMKAVNRKTPGHGYRVHDGSRLCFQGRCYTCRGLLNRH